MNSTVNKLLKPEEMAELLGVHPGTLANWRCRGVGPQYLKLGKSRTSPIRYLPVQDVEDLPREAQQ